MRARRDWRGLVAVGVGILMLAAGVPLLVPTWVLERREPPAPPPPVEAPDPKPPVPPREPAKDSGTQEPPRPPG
jgi:hypothetical protein